MSKVVVDLELDPALEAEHYLEPPRLKQRLDIEEDQVSTGVHSGVVAVSE
jgi:hypothetical protein